MEDDQSSPIVADLVTADRSENPTSLVADDSYHPASINLVHLLAWGGLFAFLIVLAKGPLDLLEPLGSSPAPEALRWNAVVVVRYAILAAGLVGVLVLLFDGIRGIKGNPQPGHMLLMIFAMQEILVSLAPLLFKSMVPERVIHAQEGHIMWSITIYLVPYLVAFCFCAVALIGSERWYWRVVLGSTLVWCLMRMLYYGCAACGAISISLYQQSIFTTIAALVAVFIIGPFLLVAMILDIKGSDRHDWMHWLGIVVPISWFLTSAFLRMGDPWLGFTMGG